MPRPEHPEQADINCEVIELMHNSRESVEIIVFLKERNYPMNDQLKQKKGTCDADELSHHAYLQREGFLETSNIVVSHNIVMHFQSLKDKERVPQDQYKQSQVEYIDDHANEILDAINIH